MLLQLVDQDQAYARLTNFTGQSYFIRQLPCLITSRSHKPKIIAKYSQYTLGITKSNYKGLQGMIYYDGVANFRVLGFVSIKVNGVEIKKCESWVMEDILVNMEENVKKYGIIVDNLEDHSVILTDLTSILFQSSVSSPDLFYFSLPQQTIVKYQTKISPIKTSNPPKTTKPIQNKSLTNNSNIGKWTSDDRQQLKKLMLQFGYGRWRSLQRSSTLMGGKLEVKPIQEVKAYTNSFVRSLGMSLPPEEKELQTFLLSIIEEGPGQTYLPPNPKDWDYQIPLSQRAIQYTKRLQLLNRVKTLVKKYKQQAVKTLQKDERVNWDGLLNFIPTNHLFGQRPSSWWAKKHDVDLILGVYKYGYANYTVIKSAKEYCFAEFEIAHNYQDFPSADNLTRRLKKLMQTVMRIEMNEGKIDFDDDGEESEPDKGWSEIEKKELFNLLVQMGTPLTADGRSNYMQLRERMKIIIKEFDKTVGQLQKMAAKIKWTCQQLLTQSMKMKQQQSHKFNISFQMAAKFNKHLNMLGFIRKNILANDAQLFTANLGELKEKNLELTNSDVAFVSAGYDEAVNDLLLLNWIGKNGLTACSGQLKMSESKAIARAEWLCEIFKVFKDKHNEKKKKIKESSKEQRKRTKFQLARDKSGNIVFPLTVNPSLKLVATGKLCTLPSYNSQHNLFPIGFVTIRTHASMITKGARAHYTCQILQGDGRPIYKVTPSQQPDQPIIKDSSTGCWVRICQRVNDLQDVKKDKVTISGTERFGLLEPNVVRLLEDLPESEKCMKYKFKFKQVEGRMLEE